MRKILMSFLVLSIGTILSIPSVSLAHPHDEATKGKDSIEWVALWGFPQTREEQLERMLTTELQRKTLFALQEKQYLKTGKENVYSIDPFQVANMRTVDGGFYVMDVIASVHKVIHNEVDKKVEKYQITFRHNYDLGFVVMNVVKK
ncbi:MULTISPECIES: hypothetical protein [Paenibacillus]|uniref:hypothetical protein n=1 Tax=Paenibacillus TaxID=44249 RepID=UPI000422595B|nr:MULTISPECIES: hypothetical protein [Paenibacillus]KGP80261.1 hypothetical protein P363_0130435 [Paenibacillus sp. MAEPY1]KGP80290.1 hypothetical protein P364_0119710 [Paenibacillus sp. MAEPY2]OZQ68538.1 hypothetical protein CA599_15675 [Paenibacillus taichungensis]HBU82393.1 hypothetical protein [Paenibacillus sp.]